MHWTIGLLALSGGMAAASGAFAQQTDCKNPLTQMEMTSCEQDRYDTADKALNEQWTKTRAQTAGVDKNLEEKDRGAEKALLTAQRAWISYRDAECQAEGFQARGGSMEPMLVAGCLANLTDQRTKELKELSDALGN
ncbi:lysozyme inhibitor LprI family protein [Rhizobium sp. LjRoot258]|uniref:lysozyme inhibitor LprI family protein n=1 Tax=Rhizobium sp. LjRoot258 TaxID=3342299 RepID=UPI003ECD7822